jgi:hypothetical protein
MPLSSLRQTHRPPTYPLHAARTHSRLQSRSRMNPSAIPYQHAICLISHQPTYSISNPDLSILDVTSHLHKHVCTSPCVSTLRSSKVLSKACGSCVLKLPKTAWLHGAKRSRHVTVRERMGAREFVNWSVVGGSVEVETAVGPRSMLV